MDMNKILQNFETAAKGEYTPSKQESSDMKMILESFYEVAADDAKPQQLDEIASVSMSGETADEVAQLVKLLNDAGAPEAAPVGAQPTTMHEPAPCDGPPDMPPKDTMITPKMMDDFDVEEEPVAEDDWDNAPEETYDDHEKMTLDLSGGINRRKPKGSIRVKDPANFSENSLAEELSSMLKKKMSEKKKAKPDYLDLDKDGDTKEPMKKAAKDAKKKKAPVKESENATDGKTETIEIGWGEEVEVKHTPQGRLLIGEDIPAAVYHSGHGGENAERFIDFVYNMDTKKVIEWPEKMSDEYEELDKEAFLDVVDWIAIDVQTKLKSSGTKFESKNSDKEVDEAGKMKGGGDDPCWKGYKMVGTKKKGGKEVPNCVPREGVEEAAPKNSPVKKHMDKLTRPKTHKNKKNAEKRGEQKHKGNEIQYESAPVFNRYVKPLLDKSPKQIVEFYDTEAYAIIDRLSRESRALAKQNVNTRVHDSIVGKLRENLSVLPETKLDEMRRRRSSFDIGRTGYGPGGDLGAADKRDFKRREMEVELGDEEPSRSRRPQLKGMYFYDVPPGKEEEARALGIKPTKSGKMAMKIYDTSGRSTSYRKNLADEQFGPGKYWSPKR